MAPGATSTGRAKPKRKRARKTRTAIVSDASSSSSSSSSDSSDDEVLPVSTKEVEVAQTKDSIDSGSDLDSQSSSSSSSSSTRSHVSLQKEKEGTKGYTRRETQSPPPDIKLEFSDTSDEDEPVTLDSKCRALRPPTPEIRSELIDGAARRRREALEIKNAKKAAILAKQRQTAPHSATREEDFQALWMRMMVDEFGEELDALRKKEPTLATEGGNRMPLLIDALQAGSEIFSRGVDTAAPFKGSGKASLESDEVGLMLWTGDKAP